MLFIFRSVRETVLYEFLEAVERVYLINSVSYERDLGIFRDAEGKYAQKTLGVDAPVAFFDPYRTLERIRLLNKERCGTCVKSYRNPDGYVARNNILLLVFGKTLVLL